MQEPSIKHLEAVVKMQSDLRLRDTRQLFAILRTCNPDGKEDDIFLSSGFLPRFALTVGEIGFSYIINQPSRNSSK